MITEDYVSFEIAKLLKEKGFDEYCFHLYKGEEFFDSVSGTSAIELSTNPDILPPYMNHIPINNDYFIRCNLENCVSAPTHQMAIKWLREVHNQNVTVKAYNNIARLKTIYYAEVQNLLDLTEKGFSVNGCTFKDTYEQAVEAALKYTLENLI